MEKKPLTAAQVRSVIEGKGGSDRIPMMIHFWTNPAIFGTNQPEAEALLAEYPNDVQIIGAVMPQPSVAPADDPGYMWLLREKKEEHTGGIDSDVQMETWDERDEILENFPDPNYVNLFPDRPEPDGRYRLMTWWYCFFERFWSLRGMENALMDFYLYPDEVHRLFQKLTDFYMRVIERAHEELHADGVFVSDDIGTQTSQFFSEDIFLEFFKPYYKQLFDKAHSLGMHFWLHSCGNIDKFIPHLIEIGLDVLHPIQKYTMQEQQIVSRFGGQICFWAGFDVQRIIPYGTPEDVRREVRFLIDTYARRDGRFMLTCGNGLTPDCPIDSFRALLEETYRYGREKMQGL